MLARIMKQFLFLAFIFGAISLPSLGYSSHEPIIKFGFDVTYLCNSPSLQFQVVTPDQKTLTEKFTSHKTQGNVRRHIHVKPASTGEYTVKITNTSTEQMTVIENVIALNKHFGKKPRIHQGLPQGAILEAGESIVYTYNPDNGFNPSIPSDQQFDWDPFDWLG